MRLEMETARSPSSRMPAVSTNPGCKVRLICLQLQDFKESFSFKPPFTVEETYGGGLESCKLQVPETCFEVACLASVVAISFVSMTGQSHGLTERNQRAGT